MMNNHNIQRVHIENLILSCFINQNKALEMDEIEFNDMQVPFELFKANRTTKLTAKAIYNLKEDNRPIDDMNIICYIQKHTTLNEAEFLDISCCLWCSFDTMNLYLKQLKDLDKEESKLKMLEEI